ncbi:MAG: deoxyribodipyrimidine photo-lyase [Bdellovibrionales bacterium]
MESIGIHWFRRDLRVAGNMALKKNFSRTQGRTLGLFCFDKSFLSRPDMSFNRFQFFLKTIEALRSELRQLGGDLIVLDDAPEKAFQCVTRWIDSNPKYQLDLVSFNRDYEPFARQRDARMKEWFDQKGIEVGTARDHLLIEPWEIFKTPGNFSDSYQVYTPFSKKWRQAFVGKSVQERLRSQQLGIEYLERLEQGTTNSNIFKLTWDNVYDQASQEDQLEFYIKENAKKVTIPIPEAGSLPAFRQLKNFRQRLDHYGDRRDIPSQQGTSRFSVFFKNGSLTVPQVIYFFNLKNYDKPKTGAEKF